MEKKKESGKDKKKYILIDADNTLYVFNKERAYTKMIEYLSSSLSVDEKTVEREFKKVVEQLKNSKNIEERRREYAITILLSNLNIQGIEEDKKEEVIKKAINIFWQEIFKTTQPVKGAKEFINKIGDEYNIVIFSDEFRSPLLKKLDIALGKGWRNKVMGVVGSEDAGEMKPSPNYINEVLKKYKISPQDIEWVIGDNFKRDLEDAKKRKIKTILMKPQARDFLQAYENINKKDDTKADVLVEDLLEVIKLLSH